MQYLLDSDTLIAAKNLHYRPAFCQNFWAWIEDGYAAEKIFSLDIVYKELCSGNKDDFLRSWAERVNLDTSFFLSTKDNLSKWADLTSWAYGKNYQQGAIDKFLNREAADAWLIAHALTYENKFIIVTNEISAPLSLKSIKLPDAARAMGVQTVGLYDLLSQHAQGNFNFQT